MLCIPLAIEDTHNRRRALVRWLRPVLGFVHIAELTNSKARTDAKDLPTEGSVFVCLAGSYCVGGVVSRVRLGWT